MHLKLLIRSQTFKDNNKQCHIHKMVKKVRPILDLKKIENLAKKGFRTGFVRWQILTKLNHFSNTDP